jgi:hypothetical protein
MLGVWHVYQVTSAGADGARAFGTGCFKEHLTYDIRGLSDSELKVCVMPLWFLHLFTMFRAWNIGRRSMLNTPSITKSVQYCTNLLTLQA